MKDVISYLGQSDRLLALSVGENGFASLGSLLQAGDASYTWYPIQFQATGAEIVMERGPSFQFQIEKNRRGRTEALLGYSLLGGSEAIRYTKVREPLWMQDLTSGRYEDADQAAIVTVSEERTRIDFIETQTLSTLAREELPGIWALRELTRPGFVERVEALPQSIVMRIRGQGKRDHLLLMGIRSGTVMNLMKLKRR